MQRRSAFTLIELLVVIAVIAVLMAILMPALQRARKQAKAVACQSQLHQWSLAFSMYAQDHDGSFHPGYCGGDSVWWYEAIEPYHKGGEALRLCPAATKSVEADASHPYAAYEFREILASYGTNEWIANPPQDWTSKNAEYYWRRADAKGANNIPVFSDTIWVHVNPTNEKDPPEYDGQLAHHSVWRCCTDRHSGSINLLFMDWSTRPVRLKSLWRLKWHRQFDINAPLPIWPQWMRHLPEP